MARGLALAAAIAVSLLALAGAGGAATQQTPERGGTVVVGGAALREPGCLNAYLERCDSSLPNVGTLMGLALRGAFGIADDNSYRPDLVSRVEYTTAPPYTLTYHIRPEARWSDGEPITARDFVFTHAALRSVRGEIWEPDAQTYATVRSVRAVDSKTVRVTLRSRYAGWRGLFPRVLPAHALRGEDFSTVWLHGVRNPKTGRPIGSGPFLVESWERGHSVTFVRNPRYWKSHPAFLDRLVLRFCDPCVSVADEQVAWLRAGEVDLNVSSQLSSPQVREVRGIPGMRALAERGANWEHLDIRVGEGGHPMLDRKPVRQALALGIDRVAIARALYTEIDRRYPPSDSTVFLTFGAHYQPNWRRYRYNPNEARKLLEREGCRRGPDGIYVCGERRLSLRLATLGAQPRRAQAAELIQRQLRPVGIEIEPMFASPGALFGQIVPRGDFDLLLFAWIRTPDSPASTVDLYGCGGAQNLSGYCQRLVTRDLELARGTLDLARQARILNRADARIATDVPVIPLFENPTVVAFRRNIRNVRVAPQLDLFVGVEDWWLDR